MPLHDWNDRPGWEGMHHLWITELLRWVKPRLSEGYRVYIGTAPTLAVGASGPRPDISVRTWNGGASPATATAAKTEEPDLEVAVATIDPGTALLVERSGRLIAAIELV